MERAANDTTRQDLMRIVALLISLAWVADRLCGLPLRRQLRVIPHLQHAEIVAREYAAGLAGWPEPVDVHCEMEDDLAQLAQRFRALAMVLAVIAAGLPSSFEKPELFGVPGQAHLNARLPHRLACLAAKPFDTS